MVYRVAIQNNDTIIERFTTDQLPYTIYYHTLPCARWYILLLSIYSDGKPALDGHLAGLVGRTCNS